MPFESKLTPQARVALVARYKAGESVKAIAEQYGVTASTVRNCARAAGLKIHKVGRPRLATA